MTADADGESSLWLETSARTDFPQLQEDIEVDVAVIGGGISGITTAYVLTQHDYDVALLERDRLVEGVTANTTAKITVGHDLIYRKLTDTMGQDKARTYLEANQAALEQVAEWVQLHDIDCNFERDELYVYNQRGGSVSNETIREEAQTVRELDVDAPVSYTENVPLRLDTAAAVKYEDQAQFHPRKYLLWMVQQVADNGGQVYEQTAATDIKHGDPCVVQTGNGSVTADEVVITTHFPFPDEGFYFARMYPYRSYVIAADVGRTPDGMHVSAGEPFYTFRSYQDADTELLIVDGQIHKTGHQGDVNHFERVEQYVRDNFPVKDVQYRWATQDYTPFDNVPYIGRLTPFHDNVYVAAGFKGWGMTHGTVAGILLTDLIRGAKNDWQDLFSPSRVDQLNLQGMKTFLQENIHIGKRYLKDKARRYPQFAGLEPGEHTVAEVGGDTVAAYRDRDGELHVVSAVCTHMGCHVDWNRTENSWDCPCHGSRFDPDGTVLEGPAQTPLEEKDAGSNVPVRGGGTETADDAEQ